jgi:hypothetical protein
LGVRGKVDLAFVVDVVNYRLMSANGESPFGLDKRVQY